MNFHNRVRAGDRVKCLTLTGRCNGTYVKPMEARSAMSWGYVLLDGDKEYTALPFANMEPLERKRTETEKFLMAYELICAQFGMEVTGTESSSRLEVGHGDEVLYRDYDPDLDATVWVSEIPDPY